MPGRIPSILGGIKPGLSGILLTVEPAIAMQLQTTIETRSGAAEIRRVLLQEIRDGVQLIRRIDDLTFRSLNNGSSVGQQFRHSLDFLNIFLAGVRVGRIDYGRRERDLQVESSRERAADRFEDVAQKLVELTEVQMRAIVSVRSEVDASTWLQSTVMREMEFVLSHTIHHHALIAEKLSTMGVRLTRSLGVSPSTKTYWGRMAA